MSGDRRPLELADVRLHHLSLVVETLLADGPSTRAELANRIGLTKATVSTLVADLIEREVVAERATRRDGRMGRPGVEIDVRARSIGALGLEISIDDVAACVVDLRGAVRTHHRILSDNRRSRPDAVVDRLRRAASQVLGSPEVADLRCVGGALAVPGLVDPATRSLVVAPNLQWHDVVLTELVPELGFPLEVENEANLAALAELRYGAGRGLTSFVHVSGGVGIGGGIVLDGALVRGTNGFAGEIGHVIVEPGGPACACGSRGCLEAVVGADAGASPERVVAGLSAALRSVVLLVDPEAVILGGRFADLPPAVVADLAERLRSQAPGHGHCDLRTSTLGADAALVGAATTALDAFVAGPTSIPRRAEARTA